MSIIHSFSQWRHYRATVRTLTLLSTEDLRDLGINRADIYRVARTICYH